MALRLVRKHNPHPLYEVHSGDVIVGRIEELIGPTKGWAWNIYGGSGVAETKEIAKERLATAWRTWLKRAGLREVDGGPPPERPALVLAGRDAQPSKVHMVMSHIFKRHQWTLLVHGSDGAFGAALEEWARGCCGFRRMPIGPAMLDQAKPIAVITYWPDESVEPLIAEARRRGIEVERADEPIYWGGERPPERLK